MMTEYGHFPRFIILTGNYGSGKTELALNLALAGAAEGMRTTLVDLDIVNPYFRSGEKAAEMKAAGIRMLMPTFALTTVDIPALPAEIQSVFEDPGDRVIFDVGGDDTGAAALGRYAPGFARYAGETAALMVVNCMRPLTGTEEDILDLSERISARGRQRIGGMINNTNLAGKTEPGMVEDGERIVLACAEKMGIGNVITAGMTSVLARCSLRTPVIPIRRYMVPEWMEEE
ncbi:MAG: ParA family protein [Clostridia bacterium]|nr:ParA family protein [Clostridia bacterium]